MRKGFSFLCLCLVSVHLLQSIDCLPPVDPDVRAEMEAKVMSSMSLREYESLVENDERVRNAPKPKIIILPKGKNAEEGDAYIIERKPKKYWKKAEPTGIEYRSGAVEFDDNIGRSSLEPDYKFASSFKYEEDFPSLFSISDMESAGSSPVRQFYESIVERVLGKGKYEPMAVLESAASEDAPSYKPRFDYDSYARDPTDTKLKGKAYWKEAPERREEKIDENGCRTVVKKIMDPEEEKKSGSTNAKTVVITKECEYPHADGPDAKLPGVQPKFRMDTSRLDLDAPSDFGRYDDEPSPYQSSRPVELELGKSGAKDPLAPDYIDKMLDSHFSSFPSFKNPVSSFQDYQERFKLRTPEGFKDVKPKVGVHAYEYSQPESGFEGDARAPLAGAMESTADSPRTYEHHYHYDYPAKTQKSAEPIGYDDEREPSVEDKAANPKDPKMLKKSFAYYRKDNPKSDPNDHQYAEEYAQGNYRSFSSSYDSEKDGPKKS